MEGEAHRTAAVVHTGTQENTERIMKYVRIKKEQM